jgi:hypothetical protein
MWLARASEWISLAGTWWLSSISQPSPVVVVSFLQWPYIFQAPLPTSALQALTTISHAGGLLSSHLLPFFGAVNLLWWSCCVVFGFLGLFVVFLFYFFVFHFVS